jgi:GH15 family glucan-1,4-alpha-glucosidase
VRGGSFSLRPRDPFFTASRRYVDRTAVLETDFSTDSGSARLLDLMPIDDGARSLRPMREVLRAIEGMDGTIEIEVRLDVQPDYARRHPRPRKRGRLGWAYVWGDEVLVVRSDIELRLEGDALVGTAALGVGERRYLSLAYTKSDPAILPPLQHHAEERISDTIHWWREWADRCRYEGPYREQVVRSVVTLKLLTYALSGAIVAAPTTSLPEKISGERNWDYRYCWLRDATLTTQALLATGYRQEAMAFLGWMLHATRLSWPELQVMYDVFGRTRLNESELTHLAGYAGSRPVRIGNDAYRQRQLDIYGEVVTAASAALAGNGRLDSESARMLTGLGDVVCRQWHESDSSIWEVRGPLRHYTFSKVMCWAALDGLLKLHDDGAIALAPAKVETFGRERAAIEQAIERRGFNAAIGSYASVLDGDKVDASLLLMACIGYKDAGDPRMRATYDRIHQRLGRNGLLYRYERFDGIDGVEGAFGICGFWAIDNLAKRGDLDAAERRFQHMLAHANDLGLYAEEIDVASGAALGNFPQAFTHVGLINAAVAIERARA